MSDIPAICFSPELIRAYPEAKVILTLRDVDEWHEYVSSQQYQQESDIQEISIDSLARQYV